MDGTLRQRPGRRPRGRRGHPHFVRLRAAVTAGGTAPVASGLTLEGPGTRSPGDTARYGRARRADPHPDRCDDPSQRRRPPPSRQHRQRQRRKRSPDPRPRRRDDTEMAMPEAPLDHAPVVPLQAVELTILTCWAEAVAEALAASPHQPNTILDDARAGGAVAPAVGCPRNPRPIWRPPSRTWPAWSPHAPRPSRRYWPQRTSITATATTATWCAQSCARNSRRLDAR